jgi:RNA polymerase sigma-70 factor (sigma-E family)
VVGASREGCRVGDFEDFFDARVHRLRRVAYGLTGDWQLAEDLTQETFVRLYRHWRRIQGYNVDAYARRVMVNRYIDDTRFRRDVPTERVPDGAVPARDWETSHDLMRALLDLPPRTRAVVVMRYLDDMSINDVAHTLRISTGTVKSLTSRALVMLRGRLDLETTDLTTDRQAPC